MISSESEPALPLRLKDRFRNALRIPPATEPHLAAALRDATSSTGNFIRAQLAYAIARSQGATDAAALDLAIALEYFHTASLLFDDLPSMDDADQRRGVACLHRVYGEGTTVLAALALINRAYALVWSVAAQAEATQRTAALAYLERYLGLEGLLQGQSLDIHYGVTARHARSPHSIARGKTVGLMRLSLVIPAQINGAGPEAIRLLDHLAVFWGLAYQAIDDTKDVMHAPEQVGKTTARDHALDRPNIVLHRGAEAALRTLQKQVRYGEIALARLIELDPRFACLRPGSARLAREVASIQMEPAGEAA